MTDRKSSNQKSPLFFKWYKYIILKKISRVMGLISAFLALILIIWTKELRFGIIIGFWLVLPSFLLYHLFKVRMPAKKRSLIIGLITYNGEYDLAKIAQLMDISIKEVIDTTNQEIIYGYLQGEIIENQFHPKVAETIESILSPEQIRKLESILEIRKRISIDKVAKQLKIPKNKLLDFLYQSTDEGKLAIISNEEEKSNDKGK